MYITYEEPLKGKTFTEMKTLNTIRNLSRKNGGKLKHGILKN